MTVINRFGERKRPVVKCPPGRTKQAHKQECDINFVLQRYAKTGVLPQLIKENPAFGDFSEVQDYQTSLEIVAKAKMQFQGLPAPVRRRFGEDAAAFLAFAQDPRNQDEMVRMGLAKAKETAPEAPASPRGASKKGAPTQEGSGARNAENEAKTDRKGQS